MREPLLSDEALNKIVIDMGGNDDDTANAVRDFYEEKLRPIPVSERLPDPGKTHWVLIFFKGIGWMDGYRIKDGWRIRDGDGRPHLRIEDENVSHWKEMPPAP